MVPATKCRKSERSGSSFSPSRVPERGFSVSIDIPLVKRALNNRRLIRREKKWVCPVFCERTAVVGIETRVANQLAESQTNPASSAARGFSTLIHFFTETSQHSTNSRAAEREEGKRAKTSPWSSIPTINV